MGLKSEKYKGFTIDFVKTRTQVHTRINDFPVKGKNKVFYVSAKESGLSLAKTYINNIKGADKPIIVGKNMITYDKDSNGWIVEVRQYVDNGTPMYSVWDVVKKKEDAMKIAKILTPENEYEKHNYYLYNQRNIFAIR